MELNFSNPVSFRSGIRKLVLAALISVSTLFAAHAGNDLPTDKNKPVSITSLGVFEGSMAFNLKYDNVNEDKLLITLSDSEGLVLYKEILTSKTVDKTFKTSSELGVIVLTLTNLKDKSAHKFSITNERRFVEEVSILSIK